jgi:hypothetical protein
VNSGNQIMIAVTGPNAATARIHNFASPYVAGASKVLLKGKVTSVDTATGTLTIGKQVVDYTNLLADANVSYSVGTILTIVGTQPVLNGMLLANEIR